jgi:phenylalanyl-tRNA synthetase alpha chain
MLSDSDLKVLKAISEGYSDPQAVAERLEMKIESVRASADALGEEGLVKVFKSAEEMFSLTEEGKGYAREGLPERRLQGMIGGGVQLSELKDPTTKIGLGWLRKKGWASIEGGAVMPSGEAPKGKDEEALEALLRGPRSGSEIDKEALAALKSRGLVESSHSKSWRYEITEKGKSLVETPVERALTITTSAIVVDGVINQLTSDLIKCGEWGVDLGGVPGLNYVRYNDKLYHARPYDVSLSAERIHPGKRHPYQRLLDRMRHIMLEMGFTEIRGEIIQSSFWNFDALFQPQDHPARDMQDTFYLETKAEIPEFSRVKEMHERGGDVGSTGWGGIWSSEVARQEVLRTHTTAITIKYLADNPEPPVKAFLIDRAYRREAVDATHTPEFEQLEGVIMDEGVSFANLLAVLKEFYTKMGFMEVRFRPGYFPYTEPSVEPEVFIDGLGWVELGGAGVFRKEVTAPFGLDHPVLAWGLGVSRVAMLRLGLKDLRELYQSDVEWLRGTPISMKV